jgi:flotillin
MQPKHEEFKLKLQQVTDIELAKINIQKDIAHAQASVISEALKASNINIVGGETMFYENILGAITKGKSIDNFVNNSVVVQDLQHALLNGNGMDGSVGDKLKKLIKQFGISSEDVKNLTISALLFKMLSLTKDDGVKGILNELMNKAKKDGFADKNAGAIF